MVRPHVILLLLVLWSVECNLITKRAQLSSKRDAVGGIQVEDLYYFAGGFEFNDLVPTNIIEIYNITSGEWEEPIFLEEARGFISATTSDENIYFVGGVRHPSCAMIYNMDIHQYEDIGCGPTVRTAIQISYHNDTLTVLGAFSADFFNASKQWYYISNLTSWMQQISGGAKFVHQNLIVGIGGINTTTSEQLYDAWIFNTDTNELTIFSNVTTATSDQLENSGFTAGSGRIVIYTASLYFVHEFGTTQWQQGFMTGINKALLFNSFMVLINSTGSIMYDLNTMESKWRDGIVNFFVLENQMVLYSQSELFVYEDGQLITTIALDFQITLAVHWGDKYVFHYPGSFLRLYDPETKTISNLPPKPSILTVIVPFNNTTLVLFSLTNALIYDIETNITIEVQIGVTAAQLIGTDIVSARNNRVWINLNDTASLNLTVVSGSALVDDSAIYGPALQNYLYIDVLNYKTREWLPRIAMNSYAINSGKSFLPVCLIDDILLMVWRGQVWRYNLTTKEVSVATVSIRQWSAYQVNSMVPVLNHTSYFPISASALFTVNSTTQDVHDTLQLSGTVNQFVTYNNTIYATIQYGGSFYSISTFDLSHLYELDTNILPAPQVSVSLAVLDDTLVVLGNDGSVYGLLLSDRLTWYKTPLQNSFIRPITVAMQDGTFMIVGGKHVQFSTYTDEILFISASAVIELGTKISISEPVLSIQPSILTPDNSAGNTGLSEGGLVAAIVVPIVVAIGGTVALVVILVKRRNSKKSSLATTAGLEARYGTWFIPFNQITFGDQLGQGSSGQVFKGTWNNTTVALKVSMTQANSTVIAELELMIQLRPHPNVVQLLGFSVHPETDSIILIIEFCDGGSLDTRLYDTRDEITQREKIQWLIGIAKGLSHLHSNNIVHRDVAARNILVHRNEPKVTDFGMSRLIDEQKQHGTTKSELGPIRWMSPESLKNKEYSTMSDIWSFGILMFEVVVRQEPHSDADPIEIGRLIRDSGLTPVIPPTSSCHPQLAEIMKQCWQMSPQSRPTIETIIKMLESIIVAE